MPITTLTKLEAVNEMLSVIGVTPIAALGADDESQLAESILDEVTRQVQGEGWWFNTEHRVEFLGGGSPITVAANVLSMDIPKRGPYASTIKDFALLNGQIYDLTDKTFTIEEEKLLATVVYGYDFEELPQVAREYLMILAARRFQERTQGSPKHARYTREDEFRARGRLMKQHTRQGEFKLLSDYDGYRTLNKHRRRY